MQGPISSEEGTTQTIHGRFPEIQGQNLALTVLYVPYSIDSGHGFWSLVWSYGLGGVQNLFVEHAKEALLEVAHLLQGVLIALPHQARTCFLSARYPCIRFLCFSSGEPR